LKVWFFIGLPLKVITFTKEKTISKRESFEKAKKRFYKRKHILLYRCDVSFFSMTTECMG